MRFSFSRSLINGPQVSSLRYLERVLDLEEELSRRRRRRRQLSRVCGSCLRRVASCSTNRSLTASSPPKASGFIDCSTSLQVTGPQTRNRRCQSSSSAAGPSSSEASSSAQPPPAAAVDVWCAFVAGDIRDLSGTSEHEGWTLENFARQAKIKDAGLLLSEVAGVRSYTCADLNCPTVPLPLS